MRPVAASTVICFFVVFVLAVLPGPAQAQTFNVIHNFTGGHDGNAPLAGLTMPGVGNLYGTAAGGGEYDYGVVFRLTHKGSGWTFTPLYSFQGGNDGVEPLARVIVGPNGSLYGTTNRGGGDTATLQAAAQFSI
jgi:uncharacterized repeat protein (TIGR03803 family)